MQEFILYAYHFRSRAERVLWTLRELRLPYKVIRLDPFIGETSTADFLKLNPLKKIPVLVHGERVLTESLAIMEYLNDISTDIKLIPTHPDDRYRYHQAMFYAATEIEAYLWIADQNTRLKSRYAWPDGTAEAAVVRVQAALPSVFERLGHSAYMAGDWFTLADIYYYACLTWATKYAIELPEHVLKYLAHLSERAAFPIEMA